MHDQDPDVFRWGLHLLLGDSRNSESLETAVQDDISIYDRECPRESTSARDCATTENDAIIAQTLQEEFSHVAIAEASGPLDESAEHLQASVVAQDWLGQSMMSYNSGDEDSPKEANFLEPSSSCTSPGGTLNEGECSLELRDFSVYDSEVGKRLNQMVPVPHVPRINGEIPSLDEATSDHERLVERLQLYELEEHEVEGDGNCQFRALSDQFYDTTEYHEFTRQQVVNQLMAHPEIYEGYVPMAYDDYLKKISKPGEWGDHVTLQAAADSYGVKIFILTSFKDTCYIEILPNIQNSSRVIFLSFWAEVHYNSIHPKGVFCIPDRVTTGNGSTEPNHFSSVTRLIKSSAGTGTGTVPGCRPGCPGPDTGLPGGVLGGLGPSGPGNSMSADTSAGVKLTNSEMVSVLLAILFSSMAVLRSSS